MSFARWNSFDACRTEQIEIGHVEQDADTICMGIKERADKGILYKSAPTLEILKSKDGELIVGGPASWECEDYEHDIVTTEAQVNFLTKFFQLPPEYRNISIDHSNFQIATAIPKWPEENPKHFSHVHEKGMYLIGKVRTDNLAHSQHYRQLIRDGVYKMFSISGKPLRLEKVFVDMRMVRKIYDIDPIEVGIVKEGMNQKAGPITMLKQKPPAETKKQTDLSIHTIKQKIVTLEGKRQKLYETLYPKEENPEVRRQLIVLDAEIAALHQLLTDKLKVELQKLKGDVQKPFANYESWEACMTDCQTNHPDVTDCEAWCGRIKHETEGKPKSVSKTRHLPFKQQVKDIFHKHFPEYQGE